jgi:carbonic anhydrase
MRTKSNLFASLIVAAALLPSLSAAQWKTAWSYAGADGPEHWGDLDPDYAACSRGKAQSPIDIRHVMTADLPALRFDYKSGPIRIINNGHTAVRVNYPPGNGNYFFVGDTRYELTQFHFHRPSEETIRGKSYDMVIHLMHISADGKVAAVAVLLKSGRANPAIQRLWEIMPQTEGKESEIPAVAMNPAALLPLKRNYYTYAGSQTAPPCTEGVTWFVLKTPVEVSAKEIAAFAALYPHDVRPPQPLNGRIVTESR